MDGIDFSTSDKNIEFTTTGEDHPDLVEITTTNDEVTEEDLEKDDIEARLLAKTDLDETVAPSSDPTATKQGRDALKILYKLKVITKEEYLEKLKCLK
jgi:hypothetical protein